MTCRPLDVTPPHPDSAQRPDRSHPTSMLAHIAAHPPVHHKEQRMSTTTIVIFLVALLLCGGGYRAYPEASPVYVVALVLVVLVLLRIIPL